jgi:histidine kinase/DNA gyrase B/HSP90-like ATPase
MNPHEHQIPATEDFDEVEPYAPAMIESLRAVGYDLSTAIADLVDNSITANATEIDIVFFWNGEASTIAVIDNGLGMTEAKLIEAMRIGTDPTVTRDRNDLGRFGLGLKTASFSQCRRVIVSTRTDGTDIMTRCWDFDYVRATGKWRVLRKGSPKSAEYAECIGNSGTAVIWEHLDRLVSGTKAEIARDRDVFNDRIEVVEAHLAMVFHRFLERSRGVTLRINGNPVKPWDPFLTSNPATQHPEPEILAINGEAVVVDAHILPHHSKLTPQEYAQAAGPHGWVAHQGFYIYRNSRLLVAGDWLGLGVKKEEHYKLARIRIDLPNTLDDLWGLDIKKSTARAPVQLREALTKIGRATRERAVEIYRHRGSVIGRAHAEDTAFVWQQKVNHGKIFYRINRDHPLIRRMLSEDSPERATLKASLRLIEESVPVPLIILNKAQKPESESVPFEYAESSEVYDLAVQLYKALIQTGVSRTAALDRLHRMEPFNRLSEFVENLPAILDSKGIR